MKRSGQAELLLIVGIIVVVIVVAAVMLQTNTISPTLTPESRTVKDNVENFIRAGTYETLKELMWTGGLSSASGSTVEFLGKEVPYWQKDGVNSIPDIGLEVITGIEEYINTNKGALQDSMAVRSVVLGNPQVSATVLPNKIEILVNMPTTFEGGAVPQPYTIVIPTKLGDIYEFSSGFVAVNNQQRYFEHFTLSSMALSPYNDGSQTIPFLVFLTECGGFVFKTWWDMAPDMQDVIERTLANTYMPGKVPLNVGEVTVSPKYSLEPVNGKGYADIDVSFFLPDNFLLDRSNFQFSPEPITARAEPIPMTGACHSEPISPTYFVKYPVIVRIEDPLTQNAFHFAMDVAINENSPALWSAATLGIEQSFQSEICDAAYCDIDVQVKDTSDNPVAGAEVMFMGCPVGRTDESGSIQANVPCGIGDFDIYKRGFDVFEESRSSDDFAGLSVIMKKTPQINMIFHEVVIDETNGAFWIYPDTAVSPSIRTLDNNLRDSSASVSIFDVTKGKMSDFFFKSGVGKIQGVPEGDHPFSVVLYSSNTVLPEVLGMLPTTISITEDLDGESLHVYVPYYPDIATMTNALAAGTATNLANVLALCGIGPISRTEVSLTEACVIEYVDAIVI